MNAPSIPVFAQSGFLEPPTEDERREACRIVGHRYVEAGIEGLLEFEVCIHCAAMPYGRDA